MFIYFFMTIWKNNVPVLIHINYTPWQLLVKKLITHEFWQVKRPSNITNFILLTWRPFWFVGVYHKKYPVSAIKYLQNKKVSMCFFTIQVQTLLSFYTKCVTCHVVGSRCKQWAILKVSINVHKHLWVLWFMNSSVALWRIRATVWHIIKD